MQLLLVTVSEGCKVPLPCDMWQVLFDEHREKGRERERLRTHVSITKLRVDVTGSPADGKTLWSCGWWHVLLLVTHHTSDLLTRMWHPYAANRHGLLPSLSPQIKMVKISWISTADVAMFWFGGFLGTWTRSSFLAQSRQDSEKEWTQAWSVTWSVRSTSCFFVFLLFCPAGKKMLQCFDVKTLFRADALLPYSLS